MMAFSRHFSSSGPKFFSDALNVPVIFIFIFAFSKDEGFFL